jgi:hypothetical protein
MRSRVIRHSSAALVAALAIGACAKSGSSPSPGDTPSPGSEFALGGSGGGGGSGAPAGTASPGASKGGGSLVVSDASAAVTGDACQHFDVQFLPKIPLVFVLADQSGSEFDTIKGADGGNTDEFDPMRTATLAVVQSLQSEVAFGFGAYTGINPNTTPNMCPILPTVPIALDNYAAIATLYNSITPPTFKAETPAQMSLEKVSQILLQTAASQSDAGGAQPGGKYILFVTDSETDFCDDGDAVCPADAVIAEIEKLYGEGIQTLILGIGSSLTSISGPVLQSFANAGAGVTPLAPPNTAAGPPLMASDIYDQCQGVPGWKALFTAAGLATEQALGTYAPPDAGVMNAPLYSPDITNVADLTTKISAALATVKSCSFDLQGKIKVDLANAGKGQVSIDGVAVPYDSTNGWTMTTATQLDFVGTACQEWRTTGMNVGFNFPCDIIISVPQ